MFHGVMSRSSAKRGRVLLILFLCCVLRKPAALSISTRDRVDRFAGGPGDGAVRRARRPRGSYQLGAVFDGSPNPPDRCASYSDS